MQALTSIAKLMECVGLELGRKTRILVDDCIESSLQLVELSAAFLGFVRGSYLERVHVCVCVCVCVRVCAHVYACINARMCTWEMRMCACECVDV